jgi:hypothetical protein
MEDVMGRSVLMQKSSKVDFSGQPCMKTRKILSERCGALLRHGNINSRDVMPLTTNLQIEPFDVWGIDYMGPFLKLKNYEYILVTVDYVSKWVEVMPCRAADSRSSKKIFKK